MITAETVHSLSLKKSFYGYDVRNVDDFLEEVEQQLEEMEQQLEQDAQDMDELRGGLAEAVKGRSELQQRLEEVEQQLEQDVQGMDGLRRDLAKAVKGRNELQQRVETLTAEVDDAVTSQRELQKEVDRLNSLVEQYELDSTKIEKALVEIYRMREAMMKDAAAQADEMQKAAETALAQARSNADRIVMEARAYKVAVDGECEQLYQKISDFRATALEIYRQQMEAIKVFPERRPAYGLSKPMTIIQDADGKDAVFFEGED